MTAFTNMISSEQILDQLSDSVVVLDRDGKIIYFNKSAACQDHLSLKRFEKGAFLIDTLPLSRRDIVQIILNQVKTYKKPQVSEAEYKHPLGHSVYFEVTYSPVVSDNNETEQICIVSHEITHQKTFERKSLQYIHELSDLIENANALIFSVDSRYYITEWNKECIRITGKEKNDVLAQKIHNHLDEKSHHSFQHLMDRVLNGESVSNQELSVTTKAGSMVTVLVNATPKWNSANNVIGVLLVGQDITELTEYRQSLEEKVKDRTEQLKQAIEKEKELVELKNRFLSVASHEFSIPLSTISTCLKNIKVNTALRETDISNLNIIDTQVTHMKTLLNDILTIKKNETHTLKANITAIDIVSFLKNLIAEVLENVYHEHNIQATYDEPIMYITGDEKLLRNIFLNLLTNAIKFSPTQRDIFVHAFSTDGHVAVTVRDQGIGVSEGDQQKIFEPFQRGTNVKNIHGTGLGLYIVKKAVETLNGTIAIVSSLNKGTAITVTFLKATLENNE